MCCMPQWMSACNVLQRERELFASRSLDGSTCNGLKLGHYISDKYYPSVTIFTTLHFYVTYKWTIMRTNWLQTNGVRRLIDYGLSLLHLFAVPPKYLSNAKNSWTVSELTRASAVCLFLCQWKSSVLVCFLARFFHRHKINRPLMLRLVRNLGNYFLALLGCPPILQVQLVGCQDSLKSRSLFGIISCFYCLLESIISKIMYM